MLCLGGWGPGESRLVIRWVLAIGAMQTRSRSEDFPPSGNLDGEAEPNRRCVVRIACMKLPAFRQAVVAPVVAPVSGC